MPLIAIVLAAGVAAPTDAYLCESRARWEQFSKQIWGYAETGLHEEKSAKALEDLLEKEGFTVTEGVAGMPTAFVATAGKGEPVVAILAEYDALPGLSQKPGEPKKDPEKEGAPGHGCGHNLLGTAALAAGVAANRARIEQKLPGTIQVFGTPAEELLLGKVFMLKAGAKVTVLASGRDPINNEVVGRVMQKHLDRIGAPKFDDKDQEFAKALQKEVGVEQTGLSTEVVPFGPNHGGTASSDLGEVSAA